MADGTISRHQLEDLTWKSISLADSFLDQKLTLDQKDKLRQIASNIKELPVGKWMTGDCGCLVSTMLTQDDEDPVPPLHSTLAFVGVVSDDLLEATTGKGEGIIEVID